MLLMSTGGKEEAAENSGVKVLEVGSENRVSRR